MGVLASLTWLKKVKPPVYCFSPKKERVVKIRAKNVRTHMRDQQFANQQNKFSRWLTAKST